MSNLPKIAVPKFKCVLPVRGTEVTYRPWIVEEQKLLLMAVETKEKKGIEDAVKDIIIRCTEGTVDPTTLSGVDLEFLFLQLRAKSVGEVVSIKINHDECNSYTELELNVEKAEVPTFKKEDFIVWLTNDVGMKMRPPTLGDVEDLDEVEGNVSKMYELVAKMVESVFSKTGETYEFTVEELTEWLMKLESKPFNKILDFFRDVVGKRIAFDLRWTCSGCKKECRERVVGLTNFFMLSSPTTRSLPTTN